MPTRVLDLESRVTVSIVLDPSDYDAANRKLLTGKVTEAGASVGAASILVTTLFWASTSHRALDHRDLESVAAALLNAGEVHSAAVSVEKLICWRSVSVCSMSD